MPRTTTQYPKQLLTLISQLQHALLGYLESIDSSQKRSDHIRAAIEIYITSHPGFEVAGLKRHLASYRQELLDNGKEEDLAVFDKHQALFMAALKDDSPPDGHDDELLEEFDGLMASSADDF